MNDWQPIETAPKDGTAVDVWVVGYSSEPQRIIGARYYDDGHWWAFDDDEAWCIDDNRHGLPANVTHWMPIPEPPLASTEKTNG